jgi:membrane dipeptidase
MTAHDRQLDHARQLLRAHPVFDGHNDLPWAMRRAIGPHGNLDGYDLTTRTAGHTDLPRLREGGVGAQFWSVYVPVVNRTSEISYAGRQLEQIDLARRMIDRYPGDLAFCRTADEVEAAMAAGRIASLLGM